MPEHRHESPRQDGRIEPIADWEHLRFRNDDAPPRQGPPLWRARRTWRWGALIVLALLILLTVFRQPLANLFWPDTRIQQLLDQGNAALRADRLTAPDGTGARQYFEAAQALDGDRAEARDGLARVARAALDQAGRATDRDDFAAAHAALALANELQVPRAEAAALSERLRKREAADAGIESLLRQAQAAQAAGRLDGDPAAALPLFQRVLALQPNRIEALEAREDILSDLLQQAGTVMARGDLVAGGRLIARVRDYDGGHVDLPAAQAGLARAIDERLRRADTDLRRRRLDRAAEGYRQVQTVSGEDARARQGIERVAAALAESARRQAGDYHFEQAETALAQARELSPQSPVVREASQYLERVRASHANLPSSVPPRERQRRMTILLAEMAQAEARGDWMTPPGESAYDKLRAVQALAPDDPRVRRAASRVLVAAQACFEQEWRGNRVRRAQSCLSAWQTIRPGDPVLVEARRRMAQKWIAVGDERLGAGDVAFAAQALDEARGIDARAPGLSDFAERVRLARQAQR